MKRNDTGCPIKVFCVKYDLKQLLFCFSDLACAKVGIFKFSLFSLQAEAMKEILLFEYDLK